MTVRTWPLRSGRFWKLETRLFFARRSPKPSGVPHFSSKPLTFYSVSGCKLPGLLRPLQVRELSDGQLRFLCLSATLLSPRLPSLLALNEPETSLHPDLINSLARLMVRAAKHTQLWITTHSRRLAESIEQHSGLPRVRLCMVDGETKVDSSTGPR